MAEPAEKLYRAEYAKSGRASCKKCGDNIAKDSLRLAIMVQVPRQGQGQGLPFQPWASQGFPPSRPRCLQPPLPFAGWARSIPFGRCRAAAFCFCSQERRWQPSLLPTCVLLALGRLRIAAAENRLPAGMVRLYGVQIAPLERLSMSRPWGYEAQPAGRTPSASKLLLPSPAVASALNIGRVSR